MELQLKTCVRALTWSKYVKSQYNRPKNQNCLELSIEVVITTRVVSEVDTQIEVEVTTYTFSQVQEKVAIMQCKNKGGFSVELG